MSDFEDGTGNQGPDEAPQPLGDDDIEPIVQAQLSPVQAAEWKKIKDRVLYPVHPDVGTARLRQDDYDGSHDYEIALLGQQAGEIGIKLIDLKQDKPGETTSEEVLGPIIARTLRTVQALMRKQGVGSSHQVRGPITVQVRPGDRTKKIGFAGSTVDMRLEEVVGAKVSKVTDGTLDLRGSYLKPGTTAKDFFGSNEAGEINRNIEKSFIDLLTRVSQKIPGILESLFDTPITRRRELLWHILETTEERNTDRIVDEATNRFGGISNYVYLFYSEEHGMRLMQFNKFLSATGHEEANTSPRKARKALKAMSSREGLRVFRFPIKVTEQAQDILNEAGREMGMQTGMLQAGTFE